MSDKLYTIEGVNQACRTSNGSPFGIDLVDGSNIDMDGTGDYVLYDIEGGELKRFRAGSQDWYFWRDIREKLNLAKTADEAQQKTKPSIIIDITNDEYGIAEAPPGTRIEIRDYDIPSDWDGEIFTDDHGDEYERIILEN